MVELGPTKTWSQALVDGWGFRVRIDPTCLNKNIILIHDAADKPGISEYARGKEAHLTGT